MDYRMAHQQQVLEEDYDENYEPTEEEIYEYCKVLELDPVTEKDLMYIAREGIKAPLPNQWKPVEQPGGGIYYFNFETGASTWEHPCDEFYRNLLKQEREKRKRNVATSGKTGVSGKKKGIKISKQNVASSGRGNGNGILSGRGSIDPGGGVHPAQLMNGTTALAARSHLPSGTFNMAGRGGGGLSSAAQIKLGETPVGKPQVSPVHGRLAPLSVGGVKPLGPIGGLPMLKTPPSLAPVRIPSAMSQPGSSLGGSLGSTGGSGDTTRRTADSLGNTHLRNVELGNIGISNEFEEEDSNEETKSESDLGGGINKIGLLAVEDLGLKDTEDSTEDVSKELRKIMELSEGSDGDEADIAANEFLKRPSLGIPPPSPPVTAVGFGGGLNVKGAVLAGAVPSGSPRLQRPGAAKSRDKGDGIATSTTLQPATKVTHPSMPGSSGGHKNDKPLVKAISQQQGDANREAVLAEQVRTIENLKKTHSEEVAKFHQQYAQELEYLKKSLVDQNEISLDSFRKKLAAEQLADEKQLRAQKETFLSELRARIKEEGDEEEAKLVETKQDTIRKLKQQIAVEQEREERQLKEAKERTLSNIRKEIQDQQSRDESQIRSSSSGELAKLKERLEQELAEERRGIVSAHEEEMKRVRECGERELKEKKEELEREHQQQRDALREMEKEQQKALDEARTKLEKTHNIDEFKAKALETHKQAQEKLKEELASEHEREKAKLKEQHQNEIASLKKELAEELEQVRREESEKLKQERERFSRELADAKDVLTQEHESKMQQLQADYETAQNEIQQLKEEQFQKLSTMKSEHDAQCEELSKAKCEVEEQLSNLESQREQLRAKEEEIKTDEERLEKLRSANAKETEELLQKQQVELRKDIDKEKKRLQSLKKSCGALENELQELSKQKGVHLAEIENLKTEEKDYKSQLTDLVSQVQGQERNLLSGSSLKTEAKNSSPPARKGRHITELDGPGEREERRLSNGFAVVEKNKAKKPKISERVSMEESDGEGDIDMTAGSMDLAELRHSSMKVSNGFHIPTTEQHPSDSEDSSLMLNNLQDRLTSKSRELHQTLVAEQDSLVRTKAYLKEQQETLKRRKAALRHAHQKGWNNDIKSFKHKSAIEAQDDGNNTLMQDIRSKLNREAAALTELEERMKMSNRLLARKEVAINRLQASLAQELEEVSDSESATPSPPPELDFDIPSPKTYLARLKASLEKSRNYSSSSQRQSKSGRSGHTRKRRFTSPLPSEASGLPSKSREKLLTRHSGGDECSSESELSFLSSSSSSSTTLSLALANGKSGATTGMAKRALQSPKHIHFSPSTSGLVGDGRVTAWDQNVHLLTNGAPPLSEQATQSNHHTDITSTLLSGNSRSSDGNGVTKNADIMTSLQTINGQLDELLSRISPQPFASARNGPSTLATQPHSRYTPSPTPFLIGDVSAPMHRPLSVLNTSALSGSRWADPVTPPDLIDTELQRKRQAYLSTHSTVTDKSLSSDAGHSSRYASFHCQPSRPQVSTEALLKNKTDWLRRFRETLPLSSQLNLSSGAGQSLLHGGSGLGSTTAAVNRSSTLTREPHAYKPPSGATLLPSKPKLTLDGSRNTQLAQP